MEKGKDGQALNGFIYFVWELVKQYFCQGLFFLTVKIQIRLIIGTILSDWNAKKKKSVAIKPSFISLTVSN